MTKEISKILKEWKDEARVDGIILVGAYPNFKDTIKICTNKCGYMIGLHGKLHDKYFNKLKEINPKLKKIEFIETDDWYIK